VLSLRESIERPCRAWPVPVLRESLASTKGRDRAASHPHGCGQESQDDDARPLEVVRLGAAEIKGPSASLRPG